MFIFQIVVCVLFLFFVAFWVGRKIGQSRVFKLEKVLQEAKVNTEQIVRTIDEVIEKHGEEMESRTDVLKELLAVTDNKCSYVNELLSELEILRDEIKKRLLTDASGLSDTSLQSKERRLKREVDATLREHQENMYAMQDRISLLEKDNKALREELSVRQKVQPITKDDVKELITTELSAYLSFLEPDAVLEQESLDEEIAADLDSFQTSNLPSEPYPRNSKTYKVTSSFDDLERSHYVPPAPLQKKTTVAENKVLDMLAEETIPPRAAEVLELYERGLVIPQIAQTLKIGIGDAELLLRLYSRNRTIDWSD